MFNQLKSRTKKAINSVVRILCQQGGGAGLSASILLRGEGMVIRGGGGVAPKKKSPDFRSSEVGISENASPSITRVNCLLSSTTSARDMPSKRVSSRYRRNVAIMRPFEKCVMKAAILHHGLNTLNYNFVTFPRQRG